MCSKKWAMPCALDGSWYAPTPTLKVAAEVARFSSLIVITSRPLSRVKTS